MDIIIVEPTREYHLALNFLNWPYKNGNGMSLGSCMSTSSIRAYMDKRITEVFMYITMKIFVKFETKLSVKKWSFSNFEITLKLIY